MGSLGRDLVVPYYTIVVSIFFSSIPIVPIRSEAGLHT